MTREDIQEAVDSHIDYLEDSDIENVILFLESVAEEIFDEEEILQQVVNSLRESY